MAYLGGESDERIERQGVVRRDMPLPPGNNPVPVPLTDVLARAAAYRGVAPTGRVAREMAAKYYTRISPGHVVSRSQLRPVSLQRYDANFHPRGFHYPVGARTRISAHLRENPAWVADSWSAAALFGVGDFSDGADTCVLAVGDRLAPSSPERAFKRRKPVGLIPWTVYEESTPLLVAPPMFVLVSCVKAALSGEHRWWTPQVPWMSPERIRAVQVIDRFRRVFGVSGKEVLTAGAHRIEKRRLRRVVAHTSPGMDSPPETLLRLVADRVAETAELAFTPQVPVRHRGRIVTVLDLAVEPLKVGLMFDGAHHWGKGRREKDARINVALEREGWRILRVSHGMFGDVAELGELIFALLTESRRW